MAGWIFKGCFVRGPMGEGPSGVEDILLSEHDGGSRRKNGRAPYAQ